MRKPFAAVLALTMALCGATMARGESGNAVETMKNRGTLCQKEFGSYLIPDGWAESEAHSTETQFFYTLEGRDTDARPDNIGVSAGRSRYAANDHESFREAVLAQLSAQVGGQTGVTVTADGTSTAQGDVLYVFTIEDTRQSIATKQYYIVGDGRFCLMHLTCFDDPEEAVNAAGLMADSFVWAKEK